MRFTMVNKRFVIVFTVVLLSVQPLHSQVATSSIIEENRDFWNQLIQTITIANKNLLYASYVAYKDKLYDLSIDSFQECIAQNPDNQLIQGVANYYIGKNFYHIGEYKKAALFFLATERYNLNQYTPLKAAALINAALCYIAIDDTALAKTYLQKSLQYDIEGTYRTTADSLLQSIKEH